jgi:hypothetical protein
MPDPGAFGPSLLILGVVLVMLWFAFGTSRNITRGNDLLRWLQGGLPLLGRKTTLRWLGSSAVELRFTEPAEPFREVTVLAVLEPRDVPLLWLFSRARGRRDFLIFRTSLRRSPRIELEAADPSAWVSPYGEEEPEWRSVQWPGGGRAVTTAEDTAAGLVAARRTWEQLSAESGGMWRLSIRQTVPHLELHLRPPDTAKASASRLVESVKALGIELNRQAG